MAYFCVCVREREHCTSVWYRDYSWYEWSKLGDQRINIKSYPDCMMNIWQRKCNMLQHNQLMIVSYKVSNMSIH